MWLGSLWDPEHIPQKWLRPKPDRLRQQQHDAAPPLDRQKSCSTSPRSTTSPDHRASSAATASEPYDTNTSQFSSPSDMHGYVIVAAPGKKPGLAHSPFCMQPLGNLPPWLFARRCTQAHERAHQGGRPTGWQPTATTTLWTAVRQNVLKAGRKVKC